MIFDNHYCKQKEFENISRATTLKDTKKNSKLKILNNECKLNESSIILRFDVQK